jgi:hypothetical protein
MLILEGAQAAFKGKVPDAIANVLLYVLFTRLSSQSGRN